jgi:hypothetical protein
MSGSTAIPLSSDQEKQNSLESLRFGDGSTFKEISYGKGRIFWAAYLVELAEGTDAAAALYGYVAGRVGIAPMFDLQSALSPGILVFPIRFGRLSESAADAKIDLRDKLTGARLSLLLPAQHAALAVIGKRNKAVLAKYVF